jgi:hypothetical protein
MRDDQKAHGLVETNSYRGGDWERVHVLVYECISVDFSCDLPSRGWKIRRPSPVAHAWPRSAIGWMRRLIEKSLEPIHGNRFVSIVREWSECSA